MKESTKKLLFRIFAQGKTPEQITEMFRDTSGEGSRNAIGLRCAERLFEEYLALPIGEKLRVTLMPEWVSNRVHRLMDDISDLKLVDRVLLDGGDEKTLASLLDIKRKIKERMAKECIPALGNPTDSEAKEIEHELEACYEKIFGSQAPESQMR